MSSIIVYLPVPVHCSTPKAASELLAAWSKEKAAMLAEIDKKVQELARIEAFKEAKP